jgi:hypothetical protein
LFENIPNFAQQQNAGLGEDSFVGSAVVAHESVD